MSFEAPERTDLRVGSRMPDMNTNAPVVLGRAKGFYEAEGLNVTNVITDDVLTDLENGRVDIGGVVTGTLVEAVRQGRPVIAISGKRCAMIYTIAIQPDIASPADLAGKDVVVGLPGDPAAEGRMDLLAANGWEIRDVGVNFASPTGGANVWTKMFYNNELALTNFYPRHRADMEAYGANIAVDERVEWPNDFFAVHRDFLNNNPNTIGRFLRATLRSLAWYLDQSNKEEALEAMETAGFSTELERPFYQESQVSWCRNLYVQEQPYLNVLEFQRFSEAPAFTSAVHLDILQRAQTDVGVDNEPTPGAKHKV